jgi:hypothetical protein
MNLKKYKLLLPLTLGMFLIFFSCEKNIDVTVPDFTEKIVVEGWIDLNEYPVVMLTKNLPYFGTIDSTMLADQIIHHATVIVNDGITFDTLTEILNTEYYPPFQYEGSKIKGEAGKTYYLRIETGGKVFTAMTTIPQPVPLDSAWFKVEPHQDSLGYIWGSFTDPAASGNFYRLFSKRLSKDKRFFPIFESVYDDKMFNGESFNFSMMRGAVSYTSSTEDPEFGFFKIGDTVVVRACAIDEAHYDFWRTAEGEIIGGSNPFMNPTPIVTNIQGGGIGVWGGYGCSYDTVICK